MNKKILGVLIALALIVFCLTFYFLWGRDFLIHKSEITDYITERISATNKFRIKEGVVCDSDFSNNHAAYIIKVDFENGESKCYGVSFQRLPLSSRYRHTWMTEYADSDVSRVLPTDGFPYHVAYDITSYKLVESDRTMNEFLKGSIISASVIIFVYIVFSSYKYYHKNRVQS